MKTDANEVSLGMRPPATWTDFCHLRWTKRENLASRMGKERFAQMLLEQNLPHNKVLANYASAEDINLDMLPGRFVLKPSGLWSSKGVMVLHRISDTLLFFDAMTGQRFSQADIIERQVKLQGSLEKKPMRLIAEERAIDEDPAYPIPMDYKLFTFYGEVKFILQVNRNYPKQRFAFFDGDFNPLGKDQVFIPSRDTPGTHRRPKCHADLLQLAQDLSLQLKSPFISIDCYATPEGPVFGELTHTPGGPWFGSFYRFSAAFDGELGTAWRDACTRLGVDVPSVEETYEIRLKGRLMRKVSSSHPPQTFAALNNLLRKVIRRRAHW